MGPRSFDTSGGFERSGFKSGMGSVDQFNPLMVQNSFDDKNGQFNQQFISQRFDSSTSNFTKQNSFNTFAPQPNFQQQQQPNK